MDTVCVYLYASKKLAGLFWKKYDQVFGAHLSIDFEAYNHLTASFPGQPG